jgi:hypothetical protein
MIMKGMRYYVVLLMLFFAHGVCSAQTPTLPDTNYRRPYLLIDGKRADPLSLMVLDKEDIRSLVVLSPEQALKYGKENTRFGAVEITTLHPKEILNFKQLLKFFLFKKEAAKLSFVVYFGFSDDFLSPLDKELFMASLSKVQSMYMGKHYEKDFKLFLSKRYIDESKTKKNVLLDSLVQSLGMEARRRVPKDREIIIR